MNIALFPLQCILAVTGVIATIAALRLLAASGYKSLMAWHAFIFCPIITPGLIIQAWLGQPDNFAIDVTDEMYISFLLGGCVANLTIFLLIGFLGHLCYTNTKNDRANANAAAGASPNDELSTLSKFRFLTGLMVVSLSFLFYLTTDHAKFGLANARDIFVSRNYEYTYQLRLTGLDVATSTMEEHIYSLFLNTLLPLLNLTALFAVMRHKQTFWVLSYIFTAVMWSVVGILTLEKAPILMMIISSVFLFFASKPTRGKFRFKARTGLSIVAIGCVMFVILVFIYRASGFQENVLTEALGRLVLVPAWATLAHYAAVPIFQDWFYFAGSRTANLFLALGRTPMTSSLTSASGVRWSVPQTVSFLACGTRFDMNCSIVGDGWANFGYAGVAEEALVVFGLLAFWDYFFERKFPNSTKLPILCFFLGHFPPVVNNDVMFLLLGHGFLAFPLFSLWLWGAGGTGRRKIILLSPPKLQNTSDTVSEAAT